MNVGWALGAMTGPAAGGALADAVGDPTPYLLCAALALATLVVVDRTARQLQPA
jgi:predicted MFS family arabinose efflux permease